MEYIPNSKFCHKFIYSNMYGYDNWRYITSFKDVMLYATDKHNSNYMMHSKLIKDIKYVVEPNYIINNKNEIILELMNIFPSVILDDLCNYIFTNSYLDYLYNKSTQIFIKKNSILSPIEPKKITIYELFIIKKLNNIPYKSDIDMTLEKCCSLLNTPYICGYYDSFEKLEKILNLLKTIKSVKNNYIEFGYNIRHNCSLGTYFTVPIIDYNGKISENLKYKLIKNVNDYIFEEDTRTLIINSFYIKSINQDTNYMIDKNISYKRLAKIIKYSYIFDNTLFN